MRFFDDGGLSLRAACVAAAALASVALSIVPAPASETVRIAWRLAPGSRFEETQKLKHVIAYDLNKTLRGLAGSRANDVIILEERKRSLTVGANSKNVEETAITTRRYGGDDPKDKSVKQRTDKFSGMMEPDGKRTPAATLLQDAGDGALYFLPDSEVVPGQSWTFAHRIRVESELGEGPMTYGEKLVRIDERAGHRIAVIQVDGSGRIDIAKDLRAKGFKTATMTLHGTAEFDLTAGVPGAQHYSGRVQWNTRVMFANVGVIFSDSYDAEPWTAAPQRSSP